MAKKEKEVTKTDYQYLGRTIESVFASDYVSRSKLYWLSFSRGIFIGLGITIGSTLAIAVLIWFLSFFDNLPLIGHFVDQVNTTLEQ